jgi:hypothetical protein
VDPKALEPTKRDAGGLKIVNAHSGPQQHLGMASMHRGQAVSQFDPFFGQSNVLQYLVFSILLSRRLAGRYEAALLSTGSE